MRISDKWITMAVLGALCLAPFAAELHAAEPDRAPAAAKAVYRCPMHPQVVSDKPGDCPICHMRLVKVEAEAPALKADPESTCQMHDCPMMKSGEPCPMLIVGQTGETVECPACREKIKLHGEITGPEIPADRAMVFISPQKQQLIGIRTAPVLKKELKRTLTTSGSVAYDPELYDAQINYLREYRIAQGTLRNRELEFKNLYDSRWEAPRIDVARSKLVLMGMDEASMEELVAVAKADDSLLYLKPDGPIWIYADVFEFEAPWMKKGDAVMVEVPGAPGHKYEGRIHSIGSMVDPVSRTLRVRIRVENDGLLKPGMYVNATINSSAGIGLAVPEEAVFFTGRASLVFIDKGNGLFEPRHVRLGMKAGQEHQVLEGLAENESVIVNGNFLVDSESRLKAALSGMGSHSHGE